MRWLSAVLLCGFLAMAAAWQPPISLAMQDPPTPPSAGARAFCPEDEDDPNNQRVQIEPLTPQTGAVPVQDITNPYPPSPNNGSLVLTFVTLPGHTCILGSTFYPSMIMTVTSGTIDIYIEHWPGLAAAPDARAIPAGEVHPVPLALDTAETIAAGGWVKIENESFVGFRNQTDGDATFVVAGLRPAGDPGGGGCHSGCRGQP